MARQSYDKRTAKLARFSEFFFDEENEGERYLSEILANIIDRPGKFSAFLQAVGQGVFYQLAESHFIHLPITLIEDEEYQGNVEISQDKFDGLEHCGSIPLDRFCLLVKIATLFHVKCFDPNFDPWPEFHGLDEMQRKYHVQT